jgi:hypothetical protein
MLLCFISYVGTAVVSEPVFKIAGYSRRYIRI